MSQRHKITIITVTCNSEKFLERAIRSIADQEYPNLEYIIVDGGSKDGTLDIIKKYEAIITKWISEPDKGISDAFNKGIDMSIGEIIGIINSDDGLEPGALDAVAEAYDPDVDVYRGKVMLWKEDSGTKVEEIPSMHISTDGMSKISHQSTFIRKSAYKKYGTFKIEYRFAMDYDLLLRFERAGAKFKYVNHVLAFYSLGGLSFNSNEQERLRELIKIIKSHGAPKSDVVKYWLVQNTKLIANKMLGKDLTLKIRNGLMKNIG